MMDFLELDTIEDYRKYYEENYCKKPLLTFDDIPVYFAKNRFNHAFYESSDRRGAKDIFSTTRAKRMGWIKIILSSKKAIILQGWDRKKKKYDPCMRVAYEYEQFVVVIRISLKKNGTLKGNFITCYQADNSFEKIKESPLWNKEKCLKYLSSR